MSYKILISILNWNSSIDSIRCIESVLKMDRINQHDVDLLVIDNASELNDFKFLKKLLVEHNIEFIRNHVNAGFAGGHNISLQRAFSRDYDFVWLLNNDTIVYYNTLVELIRCMSEQPKCGSCSPIIKRLDKPDIVDFFGAVHDWQCLASINPKNIEVAPDFCEQNAASLWLVGTALLFRVDALRQVGVLNHEYFAYFEDNDIGVRLINHGWVNRLVFTSVVEHACFDGVITDRKPYYFYLMARNSFFFFLTHTPLAYQRFLRARLIDQSLVTAEKLARLGYTDKANACLLGIADGLFKKGGPPNLDRPVPYWIRLLRPLGRIWNRKH